ncbi:MBL fold metallo-hydrolase [Rhizobium sp. BK602]|uniref:AidB family quorum-quenching N-acyl homoserine lactonase n=1 Tax=Rhizobium sp. BK602 TaxID=2586986 RepID=UPI0016087728|nr:MBL fold metallo-hydrolase [Rhizobium sp. BK602]MBB3611635.1 glyoxylase-like metal-dependent hydrolase (beta-lactamase superfamily II) [Rhizobium sp. BK602]
MTGSFRRFGQYDVILLRDGLFEAPAEVLVHADGDAARQRAIETWGRPTLQVDVNCFALRDGDGITLVDAGTGTSWGPKYGHARSALLEAGMTPNQIRRILLTHIHGDHALGLFDGDAPYFPNAEVFVPERDFAFFTDPAARQTIPEARRSGFAIAEQLQRIYGSRIRRIGEGPVFAGIEARSLPGHTPGHSGYLVRGEKESLLIWGDALHLGDLQPGDPKIGLVFDLDAEMAARTRRAILEEAASEGWTVAGGHITGFGRVERVSEAYRIVPA